MFVRGLKMKLLLILLGVFVLFSFILFAAKNKKPFKRAFLYMLIGVFSLFAVDLLSSLSGVYIPLTELSLLTSTVGGVPGTALLVMLTLV